MAQSKERDNIPKPSLAMEPPNRLVTNRLCCMAKQKTETPARSGTVKVSISQVLLYEFWLTDVLWESLPKEKSNETNVEDSHLFLGRGSITMQALQKRGGG